jgi:hypothetical protein
MIGLGYWAVSPDWYGTSPTHAFQNTVVGVEATDLAGRSGYPLKLLVMIDGGAIIDGTGPPKNLPGCPQNNLDQTACIISNLEADTDYIDQNWAENPYYAKDSSTGANLVSVFISECSWKSIAAQCPKNVGPTNWDTIWQTVTQYVNSTYATPMEFVKEFGNFTTDPEPNPFTSSDFSGAYAWPQIAGPTAGGLYYVDSSNGGWTYPAIPSVAGDCSTSAPGCMQFYWNQTDAPPGNDYQYLGDFYSQATSTSKIAFGELFKGFDWSNAAWSYGIQKVVAQQCGQVLVNAASAANSFIESKPLVYAQTPTWNDYEEGTEVETGVDNCWRVQNASYNPATDTLTWQLNAVAGQQEFASLSTVYGYTVWAAGATGTNPSLQYVVNLPKTATSLSRVSTLIHGQFSQLYVEMVGMPLIINQMSNPANY